MDLVNLTIINNSRLSAIPEEVIDSLTFKTLNQANELLESYNLKILEYDQIMDAGKLIEQKIIIGNT